MDNTYASIKVTLSGTENQVVPHNTTYNDPTFGTAITISNPNGALRYGSSEDRFNIVCDSTLENTYIEMVIPEDWNWDGGYQQAVIPGKAYLRFNFYGYDASGN